MNPYAASFLILLHQVALGGLFALAFTPFHELSRGFYKSTAGVLLAAAVLSVWGQLDLYRRSPGFEAMAQLVTFSLFAVLLAVYLFSLWGEQVRLRARSFATALLVGLIGLLVASVGYVPALWSVEALFFPIHFVLSALLLGAALVGMLIGHWYLIDTGQSLEPFLRVFKFFVAALVAQTCFQIVAVLLLYFLGAPGTVTALERLWHEHWALMLWRALLAQAGPLVLCYMIWTTLIQFRNTMAATGLFYIALLGVFVGELLARQLLVLTSLPL